MVVNSMAKSIELNSSRKSSITGIDINLIKSIDWRSDMIGLLHAVQLQSYLRVRMMSTVWLDSHDLSMDHNRFLQVL